MADITLPNYLSNQTSKKNLYNIEMEHMNSSVSSDCHRDANEKDQIVITQSCTPLEKYDLNIQNASSQDDSYIEQSDVLPLTSPHLCRYEDCIRIHRTVLGDNRKNGDSPWNSVKSCFLVTIISLLTAWVIVFTILMQFRLI